MDMATGKLVPGGVKAETTQAGSQMSARGRTESYDWTFHSSSKSSEIGCKKSAAQGMSMRAAVFATG